MRTTSPVRVAAATAPTSVRADFNGDGYADLAIGIPNANGGAGAVIVMYGSASGLITAGSQYWTMDSPGVAGPGAAFGDRFGFRVASGDFNGDRYADVAISAPGAQGVVVLYGSRHGLQATGSQFLHGGVVSGFALASGDFNGDGFDDLAVGQPFASVKKPAAGSVAVHYGSRSGLSRTAQLWSEATAGMPGPPPQVNDNFGTALVSGHFSGRKEADLAIGVPNSQFYGAVIVLNGSTNGLTTSGSQYLESFYPYGAGGLSLAASDFNGDGFDDLVVGAPEVKTSSGEAGAIEIHYGSTSGLRETAQGSARVLAEINPGMPGPPTAAGDQFGLSMVAGDFNGDGFADVAIGVPGKNAAIVLYGSRSGITARHSQYMAGVSPSAGTLPTAVAVAAGDFNGDGIADLALGEPFSTTTQVGAGVVEAHAGSSTGLIDVSPGTAPMYSESSAGMAGPGAGANDNFGFATTGTGTSR